MAINRLAISGYGQLELNQVAFPRDGRVEAQCKLDATDFATVPAENGMILAVNAVARTIELMDAAKPFPLALVYSAEALYNDAKMGLKHFANELDGALPRLGYLAVGDKFTTNTICYDTLKFADDEALKTAVAAVGTTPLYGVPTASGAIQIVDAIPATGMALEVVKPFTMPDGQYAVQLKVVKA